MARRGFQTVAPLLILALHLVLHLALIPRRQAGSFGKGDEDRNSDSITPSQLRLKR
jgi:hypothetical protein